ncbi:MAG: hypothetical protein RH862_06345 [Leptospiraceae bacterium]
MRFGSIFLGFACTLLLIPALTAASGLSLEECQKLYAKQLLLATRAGPLSRALELNQKGLVAQTTIAAEVNSCKSQVSRKMYQCQMAAESFLEILLCEESINRGQPVSYIVEQFKKRQAAVDPGNDPGGTDSVDSVDGDPANPGQEKASAEQCEKAYGRMLSIYSDSEYLKQDPDRKRLLESWKSESARVSFQSRCVQRFSTSDAECIMNAADPEGVQKCLSVIPAN